MEAWVLAVAARGQLPLRIGLRLRLTRQRRHVALKRYREDDVGFRLLRGCPMLAFPCCMRAHRAITVGSMAEGPFGREVRPCEAAEFALSTA